jgi:hypothetical protein
MSRDPLFGSPRPYGQQKAQTSTFERLRYSNPKPAGCRESRVAFGAPVVVQAGLQQFGRRARPQDDDALVAAWVDMVMATLEISRPI